MVFVMNKLVPALLLAMFSSLSFAANVQPIANDDSPYTAVCVASLNSEAELQQELRAQGIAESDLFDLTCNGDRFKRFTAKYQDADQTAPVSDRVFAAQGSESETASLCIAAATSNQEFDRLKRELTPAEQSSLYFVRCNGKPLHRFARSNGNAEFRMR